MKRLSLISLYMVALLLLPLSLSAQNVVLSGQVTDAATGEALIGVTVYNTDRRTGTTTNTTGRYTITLPSGRPLELVFSYFSMALWAIKMLNLFVRYRLITKFWDRKLLTSKNYENNEFYLGMSCCVGHVFG